MRLPEKKERRRMVGAMCFDQMACTLPGGRGALPGACADEASEKTGASRR